MRSGAAIPTNQRWQMASQILKAMSELLFCGLVTAKRYKRGWRLAYQRKLQTVTWLIFFIIIDKIVRSESLTFSKRCVSAIFEQLWGWEPKEFCDALVGHLAHFSHLSDLSLFVL